MVGINEGMCVVYSKWCVMFDYVVKWCTFMFHNNNNNNNNNINNNNNNNNINNNNNNNNNTWCYKLFVFTFIIYNKII